MFRACRRAAVVIAAIAVLSPRGRAAPQAALSPAFSFTNVAREAGLDALTVFGGTAANKYLLETTGTGVAFTDYPADGLLALFFATGPPLQRFPTRTAPPHPPY